MFPAIGWVRANKVANEEVLGEINELRKRNADLEARLADLSPRPALEDLAGLDETVRVNGEFKESMYHRIKTWSTETTWRKIFGYVSPYLLKYPAENSVKKVLAQALFKATGREGYDASLDDQAFQTVGVQLKALGLVKIDYLENTSGGMGLFWSLTGAGERLMLELRSVRKKLADIKAP